MSDHYNAKSGEFEERRKTMTTEAALERLRADLDALASKMADDNAHMREIVDQRLDDSEKIVQNQMQHNDRILEEFQAENRRNHAENRHEHKELVSMFSSTLEKMEVQNKILVEQVTDRIKGHDARITALEIAPIKKGDGNWRRVSDIALAAIVTAVIGGMVFYATAAIKAPFVPAPSNIPAVTK
jgi:hypothetical protein